MNTTPRAVIDVGTNSVKLHVAQKQADGKWSTLADNAEVTQLGEGLNGENRKFKPAAMERTATAIEKLASKARALKASEIAAVGTMGLRTAENAAEFLAEVKKRTGVNIEVIAGNEEARLGYLGVMSGLKNPGGSIAIFDTGGGSTQLTFGNGPTITDQFSVNVGAVRLTETYKLAEVTSPDRINQALSAVSQELHQLDSAPRLDQLIGMGGAVTNLASVMLKLSTYDPTAIQGANLSRSEVHRQLELFASKAAEARRAIPGLQEKRAEIILAGACIVETVLDKLRQEKLTVSDRGLRHGVLVDRFG